MNLESFIMIEGDTELDKSIFWYTTVLFVWSIFSYRLCSWICWSPSDGFSFYSNILVDRILAMSSESFEASIEILFSIKENLFSMLERWRLLFLLNSSKGVWKNDELLAILSSYLFSSFLSVFITILFSLSSKTFGCSCPTYFYFFIKALVAGKGYVCLLLKPVVGLDRLF